MTCWTTERLLDEAKALERQARQALAQKAMAVRIGDRDEAAICQTRHDDLTVRAAQKRRLALQLRPERRQPPPAFNKRRR